LRKAFAAEISACVSGKTSQTRALLSSDAVTMRLPHDLTRLGPVLAGKDPLNHLERAQTANQHRLNILRRKHPRRARIKRRIDLIQRPSR
jgi:hypothetical protein